MYKAARLFLIIVVGVFTACQNNRNDVMAIGKKKIMPSQTGKNITMLYSDSTKLKVKLDAPQMLMYNKDVKEPLTILPKGLFVVFYNEEGQQATTLKGNYGVRYETSQRMEIKYNVEVINEKGEKLNTELLLWDEQNKKITTPVQVTITTAKQKIIGKGMEANQDFSRYELKEIIATIELDEENNL
jgi:LPS export ABC transporter protein LptC